jgi:hypothetical protein
MKKIFEYPGMNQSESGVSDILFFDSKTKVFYYQRDKQKTQYPLECVLEDLEIFGYPMIKSVIPYILFK